MTGERKASIWNTASESATTANRTNLFFPLFQQLQSSLPASATNHIQAIHISTSWKNLSGKGKSGKGHQHMISPCMNWFQTNFLLFSLVTFCNWKNVQNRTKDEREGSYFLTRGRLWLLQKVYMQELQFNVYGIYKGLPRCFSLQVKLAGEQIVFFKNILILFWQC